MHKLCFLFILLILAGCSTIVTPKQGINTLKVYHQQTSFIYVDAANNEISNALIIASLKLTSSTTSEALGIMLKTSNITPAAIAGKSNAVTAQTIKRAMEDAGSNLPKNGKLIIIGNTLEDFNDTIEYAKQAGLLVDLLSPVTNTIETDTQIIIPKYTNNQTERLNQQMQQQSNQQMNQLLQGSGFKK
ncbi:MAG: hypothetical protein K0U21_06720 [Proteobacteria bacterium]|nr:hypothetical protein [Pseudomonadota bacterium]